MYQDVCFIREAHNGVRKCTVSGLTDPPTIHPHPPEAQNRTINSELTTSFKYHTAGDRHRALAAAQYHVLLVRMQCCSYTILRV